MGLPITTPEVGPTVCVHVPVSNTFGVLPTNTTLSRPSQKGIVGFPLIAAVAVVAAPIPAGTVI